MSLIDIRTSVFAILAGVPLLACGAADQEGLDEPVGEAIVEISTVPAGAQCLQVVGTGAAAFNVTNTLTPGASSASVSLGRLPLGSSTINASVYDVACSAISGVLPSWVADSQSVTFRAGVVTNLTLTLKANNPVVANANFVGNIVSIVAGYDATGLVLSDGTTRTAGNWTPLNGGSTFTNANSSLTGVTVLAAPATYNAHGCAQRGNQVVCWGANTAGEIGTGVAIGGFTSTPVVVPGLATATQLVLGADHTCGLSTSNTVYCWGSNALGQAGLGATASTATPTQVSMPSAADLVSAGYNHTCANTYGGLRCWGSNSSGQLGDGTTTNRTTPTSLTGVEGTVSLSAGNSHTCAVRADGTARCWGSNSNGQLGDGTTTQRLTAVQVSGITDAIQVGTGWYHTCIRRLNGTVACFGDGSYGQIGDGTATDRLTPVQVPGISTAIAIAAGTIHTCALLENRTVTCWGTDNSGSSGDGQRGNNYEPTTAIIQ